MTSGSDGPRTVVHLVRHGEVFNPEGVLYGRLPGYQLSDLGRQMADRVATFFTGADVTHLRCSPLERAQETMAPIAAALDLPVVTDGRVIEGDNRFEGKKMGMDASALRDPRNWLLLRNPLTPSWGEPYREVAARMQAAIADAAEAAAGHEAVVVSHQLPIWIARLAAEGRRFVHDPRRRQCTLASVTSFAIRAGRTISVSYVEPAGDLLPKRLEKGFVAGA